MAGLVVTPGSTGQRSSNIHFRRLHLTVHELYPSKHDLKEKKTIILQMFSLNLPSLKNVSFFFLFSLSLLITKPLLIIQQTFTQHLCSRFYLGTGSVSWTNHTKLPTWWSLQLITRKEKIPADYSVLENSMSFHYTLMISLCRCLYAALFCEALLC